MKILYIIPSFQHPDVRGPSRHYHFIRELSRRHRITLLVLNRAAVSSTAMNEMASYADEVHTFGGNGHGTTLRTRLAAKVPLLGGRLEQGLWLHESVKQMKAEFDRLVQRHTFDVVLFHGKSVFPVIENCRDLPIVVDFCDATSLRIKTKMRYAGAAQLPLLGLRHAQVRQVEKKLIRKTPHVAFISHRDREAILGPDSRSQILPNGVDLEYWTRKTERPGGRTIIFTGVMDYAPNDDGARYLMDQILPRIRRSLPDLEVLIVGRNPSPALIEQARALDKVTVTGFVDDMRPYLEQATVFVAPLRYASGMQNKVLEALAMEVPVVATSVVADGLRVDGGGTPPVCVADGEQPFAESVVRLLGQEEERSRLATLGRTFIEDHFVWSRNAEKLEQMCFAATGAVRQNTRARENGSRVTLEKVK